MALDDPFEREREREYSNACCAREVYAGRERERDGI